MRLSRIIREQKIVLRALEALLAAEGDIDARVHGRPGDKMRAIEKMARRTEGVSGTEICDATGWPQGSAKVHVERLAHRHGIHAVRLKRADGTIAWRLSAIRARLRAVA